MASYRFPVVVWEDFEGYFNAALLESDTLGMGKKAADAVYQLKEYLDWSYQEDPWLAAPDFLDPKLLFFRTEVRPEYKIDNKVYPVDKPIVLRVACVHGRQQNGLLVCVLPTLGIRFYYYEAKSLKSLVLAYVQEGLKGLPERGLTRFLPPKHIELDQIHIQIDRKERRYAGEPDISTLTAVAEPLGGRGSRKGGVAASERDAIVADLAERLSGEGPSVIVVGETGVGKSAVIAAAARQAEKRRESGLDDEGQAARVKHRFWLPPARE